MRRSVICLLAGVLSAAGAATPAVAGSWGPAHTLQGSFATASIPEPPLVTMNARGNALAAWNATGIVRYAERVKGGTWLPSSNVPGGREGAGPVAAAIGASEVAAIAWTTVATRYTPSRMLLSLRPAGGTFGTALEPVPGVRAGALDLGIACDGSITLVWSDIVGVRTSTLAGSGESAAGACDGQPGGGPWSTPLTLSAGFAGAALADLVVNDAGAALVVWQSGAPGQPSAIGAALRPAGGAWEAAQTVSAPTGRATWNPKPVLDAGGGAAVGYLDGNSMVVVRRPAGGAWQTPELVSGTQLVYYPALAGNAQGDLLAAWQTLDAGNVGTIWTSVATGGTGWPVPVRLSARTEAAGWPTAAWSADGSVAVVGWTDNASNGTRASVLSAGSWRRGGLGGGYWGGVVPVAAGSNAAVAGWARPAPTNPNSARLVGRVWE